MCVCVCVCVISIYLFVCVCVCVCGLLSIFQLFVFLSLSLSSLQHVLHRQLQLPSECVTDPAGCIPSQHRIFDDFRVALIGNLSLPASAATIVPTAAASSSPVVSFFLYNCATHCAQFAHDGRWSKLSVLSILFSLSPFLPFSPPPPPTPSHPLPSPLSTPFDGELKRVCVCVYHVVGCC